VSYHQIAMICSRLGLTSEVWRRALSILILTLSVAYHMTCSINRYSHHILNYIT
jgi:hypothetical protein